MSDSWGIESVTADLLLIRHIQKCVPVLFSLDIRICPTMTLFVLF